MKPDRLRVGNGAGFWGDNLDAPVLLARAGRLDVLTLEYLAELTLAILAHQRAKDSHAGYVTDFPELLDRLAPILAEQPGLRIVTNAGGLNPHGCAARCGAILERAGQGEITLGIVTGDDILGRIPQWIADGLDLSHLETGAPMTAVADRLVSANAYLGAGPIVGCSDAGRAARDHGPGGRCVADARAGGSCLRLDVGRLAAPGGSDRRRPSHRVRRPGHRWTLVTLGGDSGPGRHRLPDRRDRPGGECRHHQARWYRRPGLGCECRRAACL